MIEAGVYALFVTAWLYWLAHRAATRIDAGLGIVVAAFATLLGLRAVFLIVTAAQLTTVP